jgi:hypothetical protein
MAGVAINDRELGARVRRLGLRQIEKYLLGDDEVLKKEIVMKLAPSILPRLNEHSGEGGGSIKINVVNYGDNTSSVLSETISNTITEIDG